MAILSVDAITEQIINQWKTSDPSVSAEIGTPERLFIEAVAEILAAAQVDFSVLDSQNDIDTMTGGRLEAYISLFGFARQQPIAASGTVTFARNAIATADIIIPVGTQVQATATDPNLPNVTFTTTLTVTLPTGGLSVDAPCQAALPGTIGNVAANSVTGFAGLKTIIGIVSMTNEVAMSGGTDIESDDDLRIRFKNGLFRNMAGTEDQFLALAVSQPNVTKAVVLGPVSRYREYVQVPLVDDTTQATGGGGTDKNYDPATVNFAHKRTTAASSIPYSKYAYSTGHYVTDGGLGADAHLYRSEVDYVFNRVPVNPTSAPRNLYTVGTTARDSHQPNITILGHGASVFPVGLEPGTVVLLEHQYISANSRNDLPSGVVNAVDVFINGEHSQSVKSREIMPGNGNRLQQANTLTWTYETSSTVNFTRKLDGSKARTETVSGNGTGNKVLPTFWQPMLTLPDTIAIKHSNLDTYTLLKARFKDAGEFYYDDPDASYTGAQTTAGYPRVANYLEVEEVNGLRGTIRARSGFEFRANAFVRLPDDSDYESFDACDAGFTGSPFTCSYTYDSNVSACQAIMEKNKQVTTDVLVHRSANRYFKLYITVMYTLGATKSVVDAAITTAVSSFFSNQYFGVAVQLSDLLQAIHNIPGADNVRWTADVVPPSAKFQISHAYTVGQFVRPLDASANGHIYVVSASGTSAGSEPTWPTGQGSTVVSGTATFQEATVVHRVEEVFKDGTSLVTATFFDTDFYLQDNQLASSPDTGQIVVQVRAANTWTS